MHSYFSQRENSLGYLTSTVARLLGNRAAKRFADAGLELTVEQWTLLVMLWDRDGLTQQDLADGLILEKSSVSRALTGLERHGWVRRVRDCEDARLRRVMLTDKARAAYDQSINITKNLLREAQEALSPQEQATLRRLLLRVLQTLHPR
jgi:DNA-binding MarR family transcriptional regulator